MYDEGSGSPKGWGKQINELEAEGSEGCGPGQAHMRAQDR